MFGLRGLLECTLRIRFLRLHSETKRRHGDIKVICSHGTEIQTLLN